MPWQGYNFEDAILISERLVYDDVFTSIHIERYKVEIDRSSDLPEQTTKNIPNLTLAEVENLNDGGINFEKEVLTTKAGAWEELTFDYSTINTTKSYQKVVVIFDLGTVGDGSSNFTFYFDDITLN